MFTLIRQELQGLSRWCVWAQRWSTSSRGRRRLKKQPPWHLLKISRLTMKPPWQHLTSCGQLEQLKTVERCCCCSWKLSTLVVVVVVTSTTFVVVMPTVAVVTMTLVAVTTTTTFAVVTSTKTSAVVTSTTFVAKSIPTFWPRFRQSDRLERRVQCSDDACICDGWKIFILLFNCNRK